MKTPDYLSYDRYKKKKDSNQNRRVLIFIATFFATLLGFTIVAKSLSPDVDVTIGDDPQMEAKDTGLGVKKFIDDRLKMIQMDDSGKSSQSDDNRASKMRSEETSKAQQVSEEKISIPSARQQQDYSTENNLIDSEETTVTKPVSKPVNKQIKTPPRPTGKDLGPYTSSKATSTRTPVSASSAKTCKVYVGRYSTLEQAKVAQEILMDSGMGVTPFVRDMGNSYTLQIGSYSSKAKADGLASELHRNSFPARVVQE